MTAELLVFKMSSAAFAQTSPELAPGITPPPLPSTIMPPAATLGLPNWLWLGLIIVLVLGAVFMFLRTRRRRAD